MLTHNLTATCWDGRLLVCNLTVEHSYLLGLQLTYNLIREIITCWNSKLLACNCITTFLLADLDFTVTDNNIANCCAGKLLACNLIAEHSYKLGYQTTINYNLIREILCKLLVCNFNKAFLLAEC